MWKQCLSYWHHSSCEDSACHTAITAHVKTVLVILTSQLMWRQCLSYWHHSSCEDSACHTDITAHETEVAELKQAIELVQILQGSYSPLRQWHLDYGIGEAWVRVLLWRETYFCLPVICLERKKNRIKKAWWEEMDKTSRKWWRSSRMSSWLHVTVLEGNNFRTVSFWDMTPRHWLLCSRRFEGTYCLHLQGWEL
jgi:hypothetical protein